MNKKLQEAIAKAKKNEYKEWLAKELSTEMRTELKNLTSKMDYDINTARAFCVALLEDVNDHKAADQVNTLLLTAE